MYGNLYDFEALYRIRKIEMEWKLEEARTLERIGKRDEASRRRGMSFLVLHSFRDIFRR